MKSLRPFWRGPWPWAMAAVVLAGYGLYQYREQHGGIRDPRPIGTAEDILQLRDRKDLNVLFVLIDTMRAERLSSYGYQRRTSPVIDWLASEGVRFGRHLSQSSWTKCSMASMWTGLYPQHTGVTRFDDVLSDEARMPAEILHEAGFHTVGLWRNGWVENYFGFDQGFETYTRPNVFPVPEEIRRENPTAENRGTDLDLVRSAEEFLRGNDSNERWFLYLHLMDLHEYTYDPETAKFGTAYADVYDNAILFVNRELDILFSMLYQRHLLDKTLIVIASDHGEAFGERGTEGHARTVYRETQEVPLVIAFPFRLHPGVVLPQRTANVDIWPTLLELLGLPGLGDVDGHSRVPEILAAARQEIPKQDQGPVVAHLDTTWGQRVDTRSPMISVADQRFRYVVQLDPKGRVTREELFDADQGDGKEREDRIEAEPDETARLREIARQYYESKPAFAPENKLEIDELQLNQLRALGYKVP